MFTTGILLMAICSVLLFVFGFMCFQENSSSGIGEAFALFFGIISVVAAIIMAGITALVYFGR